VEFEDQDVRAVINDFARARRGEYEKPWPALGDLIEVLRIKRRRQIEQRQAGRERQEQIALFWKIARERIDDSGEFNFNGVAYRSLDEVNQAPGAYQGTKAR
jgi:hypothetical protein